MTPTDESSQATALALTSPDALVAALPYLVGFEPRDSAVVLWLQGRRLLLTQRLDLPDGPGQLAQWGTAMWSHVAAGQADELVIALVTARDDATDLVDHVLHCAEQSGLQVRDALVVNGGRWRSVLCHDALCCDPNGRPVDPEVASYVAAEFAAAGIAPRPDREALVREASPDVEALARVTPLVMDQLAPDGRGRELWRDTMIEAVRTMTRDESPQSRHRPIDDALVAAVVAGLDDIRVRDTVLWDLARLDAARLRRALLLLSAGLRAAPAGLVAPVATAAAIVSWLVGDGARAQIALARALDEQPSYSLALLVQHSIRCGLPPSAWVEAMSGLTRRQCRRGAAVPAARRRAS